MNKKRVVVVISGYGGNLQGLMNACAAPDFPAQIVGVISNNPEAYGLLRAMNANIPAFVINHREYKSREEYDEALHNKFIELDAEIICLAGFMRLLTPELVNKWQGRMLNVHPSLLPEFKGMNAVEQALAAKVKKTGCTIHIVTPEVDDGPILVQKEIDIGPYDDVNSLNQKIHVSEHIAYPEALKILCNRLK